jgi:hypothetical protein
MIIQSTTKFSLLMEGSNQNAPFKKTINTLVEPLLPASLHHATSSLSREFLCKQENISHIEDVDLWASGDSELALNDQDRLQVLAPSGPGSFADHPMALIMKHIPTKILQYCQHHRLLSRRHSPCVRMY